MAVTDDETLRLDEMERMRASAGPQQRRRLAEVERRRDRLGSAGRGKL